MKQLDWAATEELAVRMTDGELSYAIRDARRAANAAWELEKAGALGYGAKSQGYYHDEISVFWRELQHRMSGKSNWSVEARIAELTKPFSAQTR